MTAPPEFHYRLPVPVGGLRPGAHPSAQLGQGQWLRRHVPFLAHPDPRRIDVRASLVDPHGGLRVRLMEQRGTVPVVVAVDLSASMGYAGAHAKRDTAADFVSALARSAHRHGDACGMVGCTSRVEPAWFLPPTRQVGAVERLAAALRRHCFAAGDAEGLLQLPAFLPSRPTLLFLLSDFHLPLTLLERLLARLSLHYVVPVVLWDRAEIEPPARAGLSLRRDLESGALRLVLLRRGTLRRWRQQYHQRQSALARLYARFGLRPLWLSHYDADAITRYFYAFP